MSVYCVKSQDPKHMQTDNDTDTIPPELWMTLTQTYTAHASATLTRERGTKLNAIKLRATFIISQGQLHSGCLITVDNVTRRNSHNSFNLELFDVPRCPLSLIALFHWLAISIAFRILENDRTYSAMFSPLTECFDVCSRRSLQMWCSLKGFK